MNIGAMFKPNGGEESVTSASSPFQKRSERRWDGKPCDLRWRDMLMTTTALTLLIVGCSLCVVMTESQDSDGSTGDLFIDLNTNCVFKVLTETPIGTGTAQLTDYRGTGSQVNIPSEVHHLGKTYTVVSIGASAFSGHGHVTSVTIPDSVTSIGDKAFFYCDGLPSITIPDSVTYIGHWAFSNCNGLTSVTIPNSVTYIGFYAFFECHGLTSVTVSESVTFIGNQAFDRCYNLTTVNILGPAYIGQYVFTDCSSLKEVNMPNVKTIGYSAFYKNQGLETICIPYGAYVDNWAFYECPRLATIIVSDSVTFAGFAFHECKSITSISFGYGVKGIGGSFQTKFFDESGKSLYPDDNSFQGHTFKGNWKQMVRVADCTVTFDPDNGRSTQTQSLKFGDKVEKPADPVKTGHTFQYWAMADGTEFDFDTGSAMNMTLKAVWKPNVYKVTYSTYSESQAQSVEYGNKISLPDGVSGSILVSKLGYKFTGWMTYIVEGDRIKTKTYLPGAEYTVTKDTTFYATWELATLTVTYVTGTEDGPTQTCGYDRGISLPDGVSGSILFSKPGYKLVGWQTEGSDRIYLPNETYTVKSNIAFTAVWKPVITLTYITGTGAYSTQSCVSDEEIYLPDGVNGTVVFSNPDHKLTGWRAMGESEVYLPGQKYTVASDVVFIAIWDPGSEPVVYTVTYDIGGDINPTQTCEQGSKICLPDSAIGSVTISKPGQRLTGWQTGDGSTYLPGAEYTITSNVTFIAVWEPTVVDVTYVTGTGQDQTLHNLYGSEIYLPDGVSGSISLSKPGHKLTGWQREGSSDTYLPGAEYTITSDITFIAVWEPVVNVTFATGTGLYYTLAYVSGDKVCLPDGVNGSILLSRTGYTLSGWQTGGVSDLFLPNFEYTVTADIMFTAAWNPVTITATFNTGEGTKLTQNYEYDSKITLPDGVSGDIAISETGKMIIGWNVNGESDVYLPGVEYTVKWASDIELTAVWGSTVTVTYVTGTETSYTQECGSGGKIFLPGSVSGISSDLEHELTGWRSGGVTYVPGAMYTVTSDVTFTAVWDSATADDGYKVIFDDGLTVMKDGVAIVSGDKVASGTVLTVEAAEMEGHTPKISLNSTAIEETTFTVNQDSALALDYTPNEYEVAFNGDDLTVKNGDKAISCFDKVAYGTVLTVELKEGTRWTGYEPRIYWQYTDITKEKKFTVGLENTLNRIDVPIDYEVFFGDDLTVMKNGVAISSGDKVAYGTELTIQAKERPGYTSKIMYNNDIEVTEGKFGVSLVNYFTAAYTQISGSYEVTFDDDLTVMKDGTAISSGEKVAYGTELTVEVTAKAGMRGHETRIYWNSTDITDEKKFTVGLTNALAVKYALEEYEVNFKSENLTVMKDGTAITTGTKVAYGTLLTVSAAVIGTNVSTVYLNGMKVIDGGFAVGLENELSVIYRTTQKVTFADGLTVMNDGVPINSGDRVILWTELTVAGTEKEGHSYTVSLNGVELAEGKFTVKEDSDLTLKYTPNPYQVIFGDGLTVKKADFTKIYSGQYLDYGTELTVEATEVPGKVSKILLNGIELNGKKFKVGLENVLSVTYNETFEVTFDKSVLTVKKNGTPIKSGDKVASGTELTVEATEKRGYASKISLNGEELTASTFNVTKKSDLAVTYTLNKYQVTFDQGLIVKKDGTGIASGTMVDYGTVLTVEVTAKAGHTSKVSLNGEELTESTFSVTRDSRLEVKYTPIKYKVTFDDDLTLRNGVKTISSGTEWDYGTVLTVGAKEKTGYSSKILLNGEELTASTFVVTQDSELLVEYTLMSYVVTFDPGLTVKNGNIAIENGTKVAYGTELTVEARAEIGKVSKILLNGTELEGGKFKVGLENVLSVTYDDIFTVTFDEDVLTVMKNGTPIRSREKVGSGTKLTVEATEKRGYASKIYLNGTCLEGTTFVVTQDSELLVEYTLMSYVVTFDPGLTVKNGNIAIENGTKVAYGAELTVEATEKRGFTSKIFLNGEELAEGKFTVDLTNVLTVKYTSTTPTPVIPDDDDSDIPIVPTTPTDASDNSTETAVVCTAVAAAAVAALAAMLLLVNPRKP